jgi:hypothetical protein
MTPEDFQKLMDELTGPLPEAVSTQRFETLLGFSRWASRLACANDFMETLLRREVELVGWDDDHDSPVVRLKR